MQKAAAADDPEDTDSHALASSDPEAWWKAYGEGDLGYSALLAAVAPSSAARQGLLSEYFVATDEDIAEGMKVPTAGHRAIAELVKAGWIKVIITTNFDRLMEQALEAAGVAPQVIARADAIVAATPLAHADVTVIKLHGDWKDLEFRNTVDELNEYPEEWVNLLRQVFNEYGLLISGWSADWDKALVRVLESTPRRYPLYWDSRSSKSDTAKGLLVQHGGHIINADSADDLFTSLSASVDALTRLAEPPLTTAMAVARLKRALPDPLRRIELEDLIMSSAATVVESLAAIPENNGTFAEFDDVLKNLEEASRPCLTLLVNVVRYDDGTHDKLLTRLLQRLLDARRRLISYTTQDNLQHYPALLALRAMSIEAVLAGRDDLLVDLLTTPRWNDPYNRRSGKSAASVLHMQRIIEDNNANGLPRWDGGRWKFPTSHLLRASLKGIFEDHGVDSATYEQLCTDVEYRTGLVQHLIDEAGSFGPNSGEFVVEDRGRSAQQRFREDVARRGDAAWSDLFGGNDLDSILASYEEVLARYPRF